MEEKNQEEALEQKDSKGLLDKFLQRVVSRKLLAWLTCTALLAQAKLDGEQWVYITAIYIGSQAAVDLVATLMRAKTGNR